MFELSRYRTKIDRAIDGLNLHDLFPRHSKNQTLLSKNCLSVSTEEYDDDCLDDKFLHRFNVPRYNSNSDEPDGDIDEAEVCAHHNEEEEEDFAGI